MRPRSLGVTRIAAACLMILLGPPIAADASLSAYGRLLSSYVRPTGVCYDAWRARPEDVRALSDLIGAWSAGDVSALAPAERKALLINLYNAKVLEIVLVQTPRQSIKEITPGPTGFGVFRELALKLSGKSISLTELEDRLRDEFQDPRIHFAINCASRSCPPIAAEPYAGPALDGQLERITRAFLASPGALGVSDDPPAGTEGGVRVRCSKIFDWYAKDFEVAGGVPAFLRKYGPPGPAAAIEAAGGAVSVAFDDYDWSLNLAADCEAR